MAVNLKTLLFAAPFPQKERDELLKIFDQLTEDQKMRLSVTAWTALSQKYQADLVYARDMILLEVQEGKRKYNQNDFVEVQTRLIHELTNKLESSGTQASIEEVQQELQKYMSKPLNQDKKS